MKAANSLIAASPTRTPCFNPSPWPSPACTFGLLGAMGSSSRGLKTAMETPSRSFMKYVPPSPSSTKSGLMPSSRPRMASSMTSETSAVSRHWEPAVNSILRLALNAFCTKLRLQSRLLEERAKKGTCRGVAGGVWGSMSGEAKGVIWTLGQTFATSSGSWMTAGGSENSAGVRGGDMTSAPQSVDAEVPGPLWLPATEDASQSVDAQVRQRLPPMVLSFECCRCTGTFRSRCSASMPARPIWSLCVAHHSSRAACMSSRRRGSCPATAVLLLSRPSRRASSDLGFHGCRAGGAS
mmetsp:Transcript_64798/g.182816  ORF Transcript_64798/g.182816 Transcript_64798/m.182816 type:complete len:295 (-) Transcript_64798:325-1209(-)